MPSLSSVKKTCHCEPVHTLAWQSVLLNVLFLPSSQENQAFLRDRIPTVASLPRNDIHFFDTLRRPIGPP